MEQTSESCRTAMRQANTRLDWGASDQRRRRSAFTCNALDFSKGSSLAVMCGRFLGPASVRQTQLSCARGTDWGVQATQTPEQLLGETAIADFAIAELAVMTRNTCSTFARTLPTRRLRGRRCRADNAPGRTLLLHRPQHPCGFGGALPGADGVTLIAIDPQRHHRGSGGPSRLRRAHCR
jgi:hypothetical protein